jgi:hypothetical protein
MDAVEYLKERARICKSFNRFCAGCPLFSVGCGKGNPDEAVDIVEQWSREHPVMTNAMKFEEVFGEKPANGKGERLCPPIAFRKSKDCSCECSECDQWWDEPYKEPEGKE